LPILFTANVPVPPSFVAYPPDKQHRQTELKPPLATASPPRSVYVSSKAARGDAPLRGVLRRVARVGVWRCPLPRRRLRRRPRQLRQLSRFERVEGSVGDQPDRVSVQRHSAAQWYSHLAVAPALPGEALPQLPAVADVLVPDRNLRAVPLGPLETDLGRAPLRAGLALQADRPLGRPAAQLPAVADGEDGLAPGGRGVPQAEDHLDRGGG